MKTLVIGGSRFVGLHVVWELLRQGHDVTVLNRGLTASELPSGIGHIACDRKDPQALKKSVGGRDWDAVFDVIAMVPEDAQSMIDALDGRVGRYVQVSTGGVYKSVDVFPWKEDFEKVKDNSAGDYGWNKQLIEQILFEAYARKGFPISIVRPGYLYGPHNNVYRESLFFDRVVKNRPVVVPGDGTYLTCFGHVDDLARLMVTMAQKKEAVGEAFNFAGEFSYPMNDYVEFIFRAVGNRTEIVHFEPGSLLMTDKDVAKVFPYRWRDHTVRDTSKSQYLLGYKEQISLEDGLAECFKWYLKAGIERKEIDFSLDDRIIASAKSKA